ncbi:DUF2505 domain-containing protein [Saccharopolyspora halophila]|uniref:DUF2505 domain-containing protein n=1 Tax=Saccharopolyspora halophila TaxID=405551 RepID=A0ABP5SEJ2_9PSEU
MARRIEHRSTSEWPAAEVYRALIDPAFIEARLKELGGSGAVLVNHAHTDDGAFQFQLRHSVSVESLPTVARSVVGGDLTIERSESWRREEDGYYTGEIAAEIAGAPCSITGSMWLRDLADTSGPAISELVVSGGVKVNLPFVGGKMEDLVVDQVQKLLADEERFATEWLAHRA